MAIDDEHSEYTARKKQWKKLRDCAAGQEAIHAAGTEYLPRLSGQSDADYKAYMGRTPFYGATARTIEGLSGMVFRKPPQYEVPAGFEKHLEDVTLDGKKLVGFAEAVVDEDLTVARAGILVDHPSVAPNTTIAQAERENIRPFMKIYTAEAIFNWKTENRNNTQTLTQVRLWEWVEIPGNGEFEMKTEKQIRVLDLNEVGQYRQRVFRKLKMPRSLVEEWIQFGPEVIPSKNGAPLDFIPFFFVGVKNGEAKPEKPPLIDLANMNISHFVSTADLEHGAHFTGLPTAVITGHSGMSADGDKPEEYRIGSQTAWIFPEADAKAQYLEFQGQGLEALEKRCAKKEEYMAFLGARMLTPEKRQAEAAETAEIHRMGETSVLASLSTSAGDSIEAALKLMVEWAGFDPSNVRFTLNHDFMAVMMDAPRLMALFQLYQGGAMAFADLLENLKRGEVIREDRTEDDIRSEIETASPFLDEDDENDE